MLLSIIIPVYQAEKYITRCLQSIVGDNKQIEIIIIDDGSTDDSLHVCNDYASRYNQISVYHNENYGVSYTRNFGISKAKGEYILFLDADDELAENAVGILVSTIKKYNYPDVIIGGYKTILSRKYLNNFDVVLPIEEGHYSEETISSIFFDLYDTNILFNIGTKVYRKSIIDDNNIRFDESISIYEDGLFCVSVLCKCKELVYVPYPYYYYHIEDNKNSLRHGYKKNLLIGVLGIQKIMRFMPCKLDSSLLLNRYIRDLTFIAKNELWQLEKFSYKFLVNIVDELLGNQKLKEIVSGAEWDVIQETFHKPQYLKKVYRDMRKEKIIVTFTRMVNVDAIFDFFYPKYKRIKNVFR